MRTKGYKKLQDVHRQMKYRCYNPNNKDYHNYGGRGIVMCEEWLEFAAFLRWARTSGYKPGATIERKNVNDGYNPSNCSWIANELQALNTRKVRLYTYKGRTKTISQWATEYNISKYTLKGRLNLGWPMESALKLEPIFGRNQFRKV